MTHLFSIILLLSINVSFSAKQSVKSREDALSWFNKYGYNPCLNSDAQCSLSFPSMLKDYQQRFKLNPTGTLDEPTRKHMNRPRCGNHDKSPSNLKLAAALTREKWSRSSLTYSLRSFPTQISEGNTNRIIRKAFDAWLGYIPLEIKQVCTDCKSDLVLDFAREQHTDTYPFDGTGGTLAHAFFPEDGRVHFDADEKWTESFSGVDTNLYLVAVHEIGHALGLDHTYDERSIMYPSYQPVPESDILPQPDRDAIQRRYGKKDSSSQTTSTTTTTTTRPTTRSTTKSRSSTTTQASVTVPSGKSHPRCRRFLDAAFNHPDGTLHTIDAGIVWRYLPNENTWDSATPSSTRSTYPNLSEELAAGVYKSNSNQIVFFSNKSVYIYDVDSQNRAKFRSSKTLQKNVQNSIVGAIYYRNQIYIITPKTIRLSQPDRNYRVSDEQSLREKFPGFTGTVKTAFSYQHLHHFFTSDRLVYVWNEDSDSWQTFAAPMETSWFACSGATSYQTERPQTKKPSEHDDHHNSPNRHSDHHHHDDHHHHHDRHRHDRRRRPFHWSRL